MDNKTFDNKFYQHKHCFLIGILLICILLTIFKTSIESWFTIILFALISAIIQFITSFFTEKGKNLATKEDVSDITSKIESIKDSYNKSLESHKIELQKEFERHKYIMNLCHSLDKTLLHHITSCLQAEAEKETTIPDNDYLLLLENNKLSRFLYTYNGRYNSIPILRNLKKISDDIDAENENHNLKSYIGNKEDITNQIPSKKKELLITTLNEALMYFIPTLNP